MAKALTEDGWTVYGLARTQSAASGVHMLPCDITREEEVSSTFAQIVDEAGRIDLLVCNAGMGISGSIEHTQMSEMKYLFDVNFFGAVRCTQQAVPVMRQQGGGKIVYTSSMAAPFTVPFQVFYSAAKAAINTLCEGVNLEMNAFGIQACALLLGDRKTTFTGSRKKNFAGDESYHGAVERCVAAMEESEQKAPSADTVAETLREVLAAEKLPLYQTCDEYGELYSWSGLGNHDKILEYFKQKYAL